MPITNSATTLVVLDGGTQGLYLLPFLEEARYLIVFDAVDYGKNAGRDGHRQRR